MCILLFPEGKDLTHAEFISFWEAVTNARNLHIHEKSLTPSTEACHVEKKECH